MLFISVTEISLLSEVDFVMCLDSLGVGNSLNFHVSKPPKEGTAAHAIIEVRCDGIIFHRCSTLPIALIPLPIALIANALFLCQSILFGSD